MTGLKCSWDYHLVQSVMVTSLNMSLSFLDILFNFKLQKWSVAEIICNGYSHYLKIFWQVAALKQQIEFLPILVCDLMCKFGQK